MISYIVNMLFQSTANVTLSSLKQVLDEAKRGCPVCFGLLHPNLLLNTNGVLATLGVGDSTKVTGTDLLHWEQICNDFSDAYEPPSTPPERAIKRKIDLLLDSVPPAKR